MSKATCRWPGCENPAKSFGLCNRDAQRARRCGNTEDPWRTWAPKKTRYAECRWPECERTDLMARGYCGPHYERARRVGNFAEPWALWMERRECAYCGAEFEAPITRAVRCCTWRCGTRLWKIEHPEECRDQNRAAAARRRARKRGAGYESFTVADVRAARGDVCYLCGELIDFNLKWPDPCSPSVDHVVPLARGGAHALANAAMTHLDCNRRKHVTLAPILLPPVVRP